MDVHSPKNGINRYWSIPIFQNQWIFRPSRCKSLSSSMAGKSPRQLVIGTSILGPGKLLEGIFHDYQFRSNIPKKRWNQGPSRSSFPGVFMVGSDSFISTIQPCLSGSFPVQKTVGMGWYPIGCRDHNMATCSGCEPQGTRLLIQFGMGIQTTGTLPSINKPMLNWGQTVNPLCLVGGLEHEFYFPVYWE